MAFQFMCPHEHLLQAEESQAGQECQCPECGVLMLIPSPGGMEPPAEPSPPSDGVGSAAGWPEPAGDAFPSLRGAPDFAALGGRTPSGAEEAAAGLTTQAPKVLHIPCPSGHVLETPEEMIGQEALCPFCNAQFRLRYDASLEHRRERELEEERRQARTARAWLHWSIAAAAVVLFGVILLFVVRASS